MPKRTRSRIVNLCEAKTLSDLVDRAAGGEEIVMAKSGKPGTRSARWPSRARLVPLHAQGVRRRRGGWEGRVWISDDFDAPLPAGIAVFG